jgi:NAD(P)-dependent dehydrogenase (short-subunit alcohol dehydrogenase family)
MDLDLSGRRAVVTGASAGIGAETVRAFASHGAQVAFCARNRDGVDALAKELADLPGAVHPLVADMSDGASVARFCDAAEGELGGVDILVNNVGASPSRNFLYTKDEEWEELFRLNLLSAVRCTRRFLPGMREQHWGRIVMVGTVASKYPNAALVDYAASKAALSATATALARKYAADNVLVNTVLPGRCRTPMWERAASEIAASSDGDLEAVFAERSRDIPVGRFGRPEEIANVVLFLASDMASYIAGAAIDIDGGLGTYAY